MKKKVVLQCPCYFTSTGLEVLLENTSLHEPFDIIINVGDVRDCEGCFGFLLAADIIFLTLSHNEYNPVPLIKLIKNLSKIHHKAKVLLMMDKSDPLMEYFSGINEINAILDASAPLDEFQERLKAFLATEKKNEFNNKTSVLLSTRELMVLNMLLSGKTPTAIANHLKLNYKTVSHHKRSALKKMGVRTWHSLFI
ncbi:MULTISPECIES: LuxR C-terminal-related transcriptional regulator [unclassified Serratia (in: enterobacteria)]|uniref:helix-turn-helix transcriptional regulator n=1 Tax=unclassified Serratia (in: enterobacteria) TaxID=2647522 RepID=UPI0005078322|nr:MULTISPECIES: LuxR C-terminal-related transcriptional regulator [unclassified Serratia (in: enterobacteria)]KFK93537.1 hypothetical protein JV45_16150 [Serratia sp. Ag2]KFL00492.1 hypothetical protein IV04_00435 [Serratia sp. Ag1]